MNISNLDTFENSQERESAMVEKYSKAQVLHYMSRKWHYKDYKDFAGLNYKDSRKKMQQKERQVQNTIIHRCI